MGGFFVFTLYFMVISVIGYYLLGSWGLITGLLLAGITYSTLVTQVDLRQTAVDPLAKLSNLTTRNGDGQLDTTT